MKEKKFRGFFYSGFGKLSPAMITARVTIDNKGATITISDDQHAMLGVDLDQLERWIKKVREEDRRK